MIFGLVRLIVLTILDRKSISRGVEILGSHTLCLQGILLCKKLSNKYSGSMFFRPVRHMYNIIL